MQLIAESRLDESVKLEILRSILTGKSIDSLLINLTPNQILETQRFVWEKTLEFGIRIKGNDFSSEEITNRFKSIALYQDEMNCKHPPHKCRGTDCFRSNPECAIKKAKNQINIMRKTICELLEIDCAA